MSADLPEWDDESIEWHCVCGSGDMAEWHSFVCAASNTPHDHWHPTRVEGCGECNERAERPPS